MVLAGLANQADSIVGRDIGEAFQAQRRDASDEDDACPFSSRIRSFQQF
jgi:hypothetical protein